MRPLYNYNGDSYTGKMSSWNWDWSQVMPWCIRYFLGGSHQHDDVIKWKHFPCYWPFVQGIHWSPVNSPHKGQWRGALMFPLICAWINGWVNNQEAGDLRHHHAHYDVSVMLKISVFHFCHGSHHVLQRWMCLCDFRDGKHGNIIS